MINGLPLDIRRHLVFWGKYFSAFDWQHVFCINKEFASIGSREESAQQWRNELIRIDRLSDPVPHQRDQRYLLILIKGFTHRDVLHYLRRLAHPDKIRIFFNLGLDHTVCVRVCYFWPHLFVLLILQQVPLAFRQQVWSMNFYKKLLRNPQPSYPMLMARALAH
jgi:hypothetical protein